MRGASWIVLLVASLSVMVAHAEPSTSEPWRTEVSLVPECLDTFAKDLVERSPVVLSPSGGRVLRLRVWRARGRFVGRLDVEDIDSRTERVIESADCREVVSGLALVAALTVDPRRG